MTTLSFQDYQRQLAAGFCNPPTVSLGRVAFDRTRAARVLREAFVHPRLAFQPIRERIGDEYFREIETVRCRTASYARRLFPAYRAVENELLRSEWHSLVDWEKFQRDHYLHQPLTAYSVLSLLDGGGNPDRPLFIGGQTLLDWTVDALRASSRLEYLRDYFREIGGPSFVLDHPEHSLVLLRAITLESAYLAALFHDIGYRWQFLRRLQGAADKSGYGGPIQQLSAEDVLRRFDGRLLLYPLHNYGKHGITGPVSWQSEVSDVLAEAIETGHGVSGAVSFLCLQDMMRSYPESAVRSVTRFCVEWAAMAILMHDMARCYAKATGIGEIAVRRQFLRLSFDRDPLSCVLALADYCQEFARRVAVFRPRNARWPVEVKYPTSCEQTTVLWEPATQHLRIDFLYSDRVAAYQKRVAYLPSERSLLFDRAEGFIDLSYCGVAGVEVNAYP